MTDPLRLLIAEDKLRDATLMVHELERAGFVVQWQRVETEQAFRQGLASPCDLVLADGTMPEFDAIRALQIVEELGLSVPVIVVTGSLTDERAVEFMKHGAADYLLKDRPARLGQAVRQALAMRRQREEARLVQEERRRFFQLSLDMLCVAGVDGFFKLLNPAWQATLGWTNEELCSRPYVDFVHPDDRAAALAEARKLATGGSTAFFENRYRCKDGSFKWLSWRSTSDPESGLIYATARDTSERRRAEAELRLRDRALQAVPQGVVIADATAPDLPTISANPAFLRMTGYSAEDVLNRNCRLLQGPGTDPAAVATLREAVKEGRSCTVEILNYRKDGAPFWNEVSISPVHDDRGLLTHFVGVQADVTARRKSAEEVREWRDRYAAAVRATGQVLYEWEPDSDALVLAGNLQAILGYTLEELGGGRAQWVELVHPDDRDAFLMETRRVETSGDSFRLEYRLRRKDGRVITVRDEGHRVAGGGAGGTRIVGLVADVSEQKRLAEQLRQAQKMEAFGQLAGGVAHDFNNLLTIINTYSELLFDELPPEDPRRELVSEVLGAGKRSAALTSQLLAFSRRQVIAPRVLDLNAIVVDTEKLLRRLIGEDIHLRVRLAARLRPIVADPGQVEQVILNLALNARDAMPRGGELVIETLNQDPSASAPRNFVCLCVTDSGLGMDAATLARIFEPFFTTKGDRGTGLGLATVYGIVEQAGGHVEVQSEVGRGTTFTVWLPAAGEQHVAERAPSRPSRVPGGTETVLVAEDDESVRRLTTHLLQQWGYRVLTCSSGSEAIEIAARHSSAIHLLLTDVVMPGLGGRETADQVVGLHPETRVLFLSGYTDDAVLRHGVRTAEVAFLQKPFTPALLAQRIRDVLEGAPAPGRARPDERAT